MATALAESWRRTAVPPPLSPGVLELIAPLLLGAGAAGLAWFRIRGSEFEKSPGAEKLRQAYRLQTILARLHERQIAQAIVLLRSVGIEPILVKGWAVARLYPEPGLRPYGDIDLCVRPDQYPAALEILSGPAGRDCPVDLHKGPPLLLNDRRWEDLWDRSQTIADGIEVRVLAPEDHLRLLCLHMLDHGVWRPLWLCDIGAALESLPSTFDWRSFLAGSPRRSQWVGCAMGLAHQILGARLDKIPVAARPKRLPRWIVPAVLRHWGVGSQTRESLLFHLRQGTGVLESLRRSWPDPITATVGVRAPLNSIPRLPFQLAQCVKRAGQIGLEVLRPPRDLSRPPR